MPKITALQRQTKRELIEGARQSKRHEREAKAFAREAKKAGMTVFQYQAHLYEKRQKAEMKRTKSTKTRVRRMPPPIVDDPNVHFPPQVRRQIEIANALLDQRGHPESPAMKLIRLEGLLTEAVGLTKMLFNGGLGHVVHAGATGSDGAGKKRDLAMVVSGDDDIRRHPGVPPRSRRPQRRRKVVRSGRRNRRRNG